MSSDLYVDGFAPDCADRACDDCRAEDCVCACHLADEPWDPSETWWGDDE